MKIYALSDIHMEFEANTEAMRQLSKCGYQDDILILAGDIGSDIGLIESAFTLLASRFKHVCYVPGNHDLWVTNGRDLTSMDKYRRICDLARACHVSMDILHMGRLSIVPLLGWYDYSFGEPGEMLRRIWMDYHECRWPKGYDERTITQNFIRRNILDIPPENTVISFSHFLPRIDVMPHYIPEQHQTLYPVLGSNLIEQQIRQIRSKIHVYGHSHVNQKKEIHGVIYINNAYGYPDETRITAKKLLCIHE